MLAGNDQLRESEDGQTFRYHPEPGEKPSQAVVRAISGVSDRPIVPAGPNGGEALEPLHDAIDPEALDKLFSTVEDDAKLTGSVTFTYCGYVVTVDGTGLVSVTEV
ncbi:MAG: HalOD1 output domain-containing protein [Salinigranum sp.]